MVDLLKVSLQYSKCLFDILNFDTDIFVNYNWVDVTVVQYTFTHKQYTEQHN